MKSILISLFIIFLFQNKNDYINSSTIYNNKVIISFYNSPTIVCKVKKEKRKKYFTINNKNIFIDATKPAIFKQNIDSFLKLNSIRPDLELGEPLPIIELVFIVDDGGNIIYKGLDKGSYSDNYQKEFFRLMTLVNFRLEPAMIDNKKVSSIIKLKINYYDLFN